MGYSASHNSLLELQFENLLNRYGVAFTRPERVKDGGRLDFYLPEFALYVEVKTYECERMLDQIRSVKGESVLLLVGPRSIEAFARFVEAIAHG